MQTPGSVGPAMVYPPKVEERSWRTLPSRVSAVWLTALCFGLVVVFGYFDYLTGYEQSFLLFYLIPISLACWSGNLALGIVFSILSVATWITSDLAAGVPAVGFWNAGMALTSYIVFTVLLSKLRGLFTELDQRVRDRTLALRREIAERERLDREVAEVGDRERRRLGQELHDGLCQHLTGTALTAQTLREKLAARSAQEVAEADKVVRYIEEGIDLSRNLARGLFSPELEPEGLMVALQALADNMTERFGIACTFDSDRHHRDERLDRRDTIVSHCAGGSDECGQTCRGAARSHSPDGNKNRRDPGGHRRRSGTAERVAAPSRARAQPDVPRSRPGRRGFSS